MAGIIRVTGIARYGIVGGYIGRSHALMNYQRAGEHYLFEIPVSAPWRGLDGRINNIRQAR